MSDNKTTIKNCFSPTSPRVQGIHEQYYRAWRFLQLARRCKKPRSQFTNLIAAIYPTRAIIELMLEAAEKQELRKFNNQDPKKSWQDYENTLVPVLPNYHLIEKIRIHDFHRFGCIPPAPKRRQLFVGGPIKLVAKKGAAIVKITDQGPQFMYSGDSYAKEQRSLYTNDGRFYEEKSEQYLSLEEILGAFLDAVPRAIAEFEHLLAGKQDDTNDATESS